MTTAFPIADGEATSFFFPALLTMLGVAVLIGLVAVARKKFMAKDEEPAAAGFSLGGLRDLVKQGKMTQDEYDKAKAMIVASAHRETAKTAREAHADLPGRRANSFADDAED